MWLSPGLGRRLSDLSLRGLSTSSSVLSTSSSSSSSSSYQSLKYNEELRRSLENPEEYWAEIASNTIWTKKWDKVCFQPKS